jgi:hypothetical protein
LFGVSRLGTGYGRAVVTGIRIVRLVVQFVRRVARIVVRRVGGTV